VLLPLLAGTGVGIAGLAIGLPELESAQNDTTFWRVFFESSVAGFLTVAGGLTAIWLRARTRPYELSESTTR
jgi:hypothetical protein